MSNESYTITLDDDPLVHKIISRMTNIQSLPFTHSEKLLARAESYHPKAVFIDINLGPEDCGLDVVPELRKIWPYVPIIVITSESGGDRVGQSLAAGANDFVKKPLDHDELLGRLNTRVAEMRERRRVDVIPFGNSAFHLKFRLLQQGEKRTYLSPAVARLLTMLLDAQGEILSKQVLMRGIWGDMRVSANSLDRRIFELRSGLDTIASNAHIRSIYGKGISLNVLAQQEAKLERKEEYYVD